MAQPKELWRRKQVSRRFQLPFFHRYQIDVDPSALHGRKIRPAVDTRLLSSQPSLHPKNLQATLEEYYLYLQARARAEGRLSLDMPLLKRWTLAYDIYSPKLHRFIEIDESQHFSNPRLERIVQHRDSPVEANYPSYFWESQLPRLLKKPFHDRRPPHRDEQRAYLDLARELIPPAYGLNPTLRIDQWSLSNSQLDITSLLHL